MPAAGEAWTRGGKPVPYGPIRVERIAGPVLVFGAGKDEIFASALAVQRIVERARAYGRSDVVGRIYPKAGHGIGCVAANLPLAGALTDGSFTYELGGTRAANERVAAASWPLVLRFLATLPR